MQPTRGLAEGEFTGRLKRAPEEGSRSETDIAGVCDVPVSEKTQSRAFSLAIHASITVSRISSGTAPVRRTTL